MTRNRSVPTDTILPHVVYSDVPAAIRWLSDVFGFAEHYRYGDSEGAQMHFGNAWIMLRRARPGSASPAHSGWYSQSLTVFVDDVDAHFAKAEAAGAKIVEGMNETMYGERQYGAEDLEGHHWLFSQHAKDVDPADWGATVAT